MRKLSNSLMPRFNQKHLLVVAAISLLFFLPIAKPAIGQECAIGLSVQTPVVNFPSPALPDAKGLTFGEVVDVNYTSAFTNQTLVVQYQNGSQWVELQRFTGNQVGFTELGIGLNSAWARFGENSLRVSSAACVSKVAALVIQKDSNAGFADLGVYVVVALVAVLFLVLGRKLGWKSFAVVAVGAYLAIAPWTGQRYDIYFLLSSGIRMLQHVNPFDPGNPALYPAPLKWAYPPIYPLYSAFAFSIYQGLTGAALPPVGALTWPGWLTSTYNVFQAFVPQTLPVLVSLLKLPIIACAVLTGLLLRKMTGADSAVAWWIANPLVILVAAVWGQIDPIATLFTLVSLYYFEKGKEYHAYLFASLGAAVKVWPALVIPIFLMVSARRSGLKAAKPLVAVLPPLILSLAVYGLYGNPLQSLFIVAYARGIPTFAGAFTVNGLTWQELLLVLGSPPVPLFLFVGIPLYAIILAWAYKRRETDVAKLLTVFILIFFLTYNYVNPQYFYWILPFLMLQKKRFETIAFTALPLVYMFFAYNIFYFVSPALLGNEFAFGASVLDQMKVTFFYQTPTVFVFVASIIPTVAYALLLYREFKDGRQAAAHRIPWPAINTTSPLKGGNPEETRPK
jgi:hypothetical protein